MEKTYSITTQDGKLVATATEAFILVWLPYRKEALQRVDRAAGEPVVLYGNGRCPDYTVRLLPKD